MVIVTFGQKQEAQEWLLILSIAYPKKRSFYLFFLLWEGFGGEGRQARSKNTLDFLSYSHVITAPL